MKLDGQVFLAEGRVWRIFAPGWRLWRWAGWLWRRVQKVPVQRMRLVLPGGEVNVRGEAIGKPRPATKLARQAPLGVRRS